jgi:hypothetical protein
LNRVYRRRGTNLEEGDQNKPVVDPEIRNKVEGETLEEAALVDPGDDSSQPEEDADIGNDDMAELVWLEEWQTGRKVVGALGVGLLARRVGEEIHWPAEELII